MADHACASCKKTDDEVPSLKTLYCSRECQKADWKAYKKVCSQQAGDNAVPRTEHSSTSNGKRAENLEKHIPNSFTRIDNGTFLRDRPEKDVYKLLIDAFRMRQADTFVFGRKKGLGSVYTGAASSIGGFCEFLGTVEQKYRAHLPAWRSADKKKECEEFREKGEDWSSSRMKVAKDGLMEHYGDDSMPMQLRMFAEEALDKPTPQVLRHEQGRA
ncbi:hypothetical protein N0V90_009411 [Kalmusia sp. IMI 367209]|nr:hypothetical protein N0V90_009411 [Kalmusia sp. IMI 367209]